MLWARRNTFHSSSSVNVDGLCCLLTRPCRKAEPTLPADRHGLLELDRNQLERTVLLGKGNYGEVYRGKYGQRDVAIKCMKTDGKNRQGNVEKFIGEAKMMKDLLHKNIVRLYGVCTEQEPIFIVTEFVAHGCLLNYLRDPQGKNLKFKNLLDYAAQVTICEKCQRGNLLTVRMSLDRQRNGLSRTKTLRPLWLSGWVSLTKDLLNSVHFFLARNILIGEADVVKIGDFGLAKTLQGGRLVVDRGLSFSPLMKRIAWSISEAQFPIKWTAPEAATSKEYTTKSDVWSFGVLLYELITYGSNPYPGMSNNEALQSVLNGYRMPKVGCHCACASWMMIVSSLSSPMTVMIITIK